MLTSNHEIDNKQVEMFLKIMAKWMNRLSSVDTGMSSEEEYQFRENFSNMVIKLNGTQLVDLIRRILEKGRQLLKDDKERGFWLEAFLGEAVCHRYSREFLNDNNIDVDQREIVEFSNDEEKELKRLLLDLKKEMPKHEQFRVISLCQELTGKRTLDEN